MSLVEDAKAAHKLHMTYGQYMATVKPLEPPKPPKPLEKANGRICELCGAPLVGKQRKYCTTCVYTANPWQWRESP